MANNEYLNAILRRLQDTIFAFMDDVRRRTHIFEGRRSVEEQLSGEYHCRFLIELIQNADDACGQDGEILLVIRQTPSQRIVVFNTGRGFTPDNFRSLCTLGLTDKKPEEAIGNKGLGFRSVLEVCEYPFIFSSNPNRPEGAQPCFDGYCFCFAPDELRNALQTAAGQIVSGVGIPSMEIAGRSFQLLEASQPDFVSSLKNSLADQEILQRAIKTLPVYEMPLPCGAQDPLLSWANERKAATAVSLQIRPGAEETFQQALAELDAYMFLFLRNARYISVYLENTGEPNKLVEFERNIPRPEDKAAIRKGHIKITYHDREAWGAIRGIKPDDLKNELQTWWFYRKPIRRKDFEAALKGLPERWHDIRQIEIELAVPITAGNDCGRFVIYLPTKAMTGTGAWANAPFYGKIDRTGIDWGREWNYCLLDHTVSCVAEMVSILRQSADITSGHVVLSLLGISDRSQTLADFQISSAQIQQIVKNEAWVLSEQDTDGEHHYAKLSELTLPEDFSWKVKPVEPIPDISCREVIPITFPHPEFDKDILKKTAEIYGIATKRPEGLDFITLAETAIQRIDKNKRTSAWWNDIYRWLGHLDIPYEALMGKRLVWTQAGKVLQVQQESRIFSPPRRLAASAEEDTPMIKKFQEVLTGTLPAAFQDRVAFLHPEIDLSDRLIRSFLIRGYGSMTTIVREFRTDQVADFILNNICKELYREKMSQNRKKSATEIFPWTFILWRQMRGEGLFVDWSQLLIPTTVGWRPANEAYAGRHWTGPEGADLEKVFQNVQPPKPFVIHPNNLIQMLPKTFQDLIREYDLRDDLREFILDALKVWTAPRILIQKSSRTGGFHPEFCPTGFYYSLDTSTLRDIPQKYKLPIEKEIWDKYLQRIERESKGRPFQMSAKYLLKEVAYLEDIKIPGTDPEALARCLGRGWNKYYSHYATTTVQRHPQESGQSLQWSVTGFVVEQFANLKWIPMRVWATREEGERENSKEFSENVTPSQVLKVNKDLLEVGSILIYSLLPHISANVESEIPEELCRKVGIVLYSPRERDVEEPFHIMRLLHQAHIHLPSGREPFLISLWHDMFDAAVSRIALGKPLADKSSAVLGFEVQKDGVRRLCWLNPVGESGTYTAWVNDNEDSLSMLPPGTFIACAGKRRTRLDDRVALLQQILDKAEVRRLSELKTLPQSDPVEGWEAPRLLSDAFPWLIQPALAVLAFGRQTLMSVSNPKGDFPPLVSRIQSARVQYVRNLKIRLEGLDVEPEPRSTFYSSSENLLLLDAKAELRLRNLAHPLTLLFDREDYLNPAELWLRNVEEVTEESRLREDVAPETAIDELRIDPTNLQELFQVIGGKTQQIIRSVGPPLFSLSKKGSSPLPAYEINSIVNKVADSGNPYDLAEKTMVSILTKSGAQDPGKCSDVLRRIAEQKRDPVEIARDVHGQLGIDLGDWNESAIEIGARSQVVWNQEGVTAFNTAQQDTRWAACGFLQKHLQDSRKAEFRGRWESYDALKPSESIYQTWSPTSAQIELPIVEWFKVQTADFGLDVIDNKHEDFLEFIRKEYSHLGRDPDSVLTDNINALNLRWRRLRIVFACLALRGMDSDAISSQLRMIDEGAPGRWIMQDDAIQSLLSVAVAKEEELFALLSGWITTQAASVIKQFEGAKANTLEEFIKSKKITIEEEKQAEEHLTKGLIIVPKQTIARKALEVPEKDRPLDDLKRKLDELLNENDQEILKKLTEDADAEACAILGDAPTPKTKTKSKTSRVSVPKEKDKDFIGYVGEYLVYRALERRYPHIGLSAWMSGNKQKFFPGSKGNDNLGYDFCIPVFGRRVLIEVKSHTGDQSYFELGSSELDAAQEALNTGDIYQVWVVRNLEGSLDIDHLPNPMDKENRKHFRFEVGRVYYQTE